jgi:hypothetical protein
MRWTPKARRTSAVEADAKPCGPDTPTLVSSPHHDLAGDGGQKARSTEEITV